MDNPTRLDTEMVIRGLCSGRDRAKSLILTGTVRVNSKICTKPKTQVSTEDIITLEKGDIPYVSRGGLKLEKAVNEFGLNLRGLICGDIGASTGGFTDCMLQNGAERVYAVDSGTNQLAEILRNDRRVISLENLNFKNADSGDIPELLGFAAVDVSFISLTAILPVLFNFMNDEACAVCLIKPQFEAGRENLSKNGVVRDRRIHSSVIKKISDFALQTGFSCENLSFSPIKGPKGNIEYLVLLKKATIKKILSKNTVDETVFLAHNILNRPKGG